MENEAFVDLAEKVKEMTEYAKDHAITIAVMGCRVNGPGETDDADLGLWCGPKVVNLKKGTEALGSLFLRRDSAETEIGIGQIDKGEPNRLVTDAGG